MKNIIFFLTVAVIVASFIPANAKDQEKLKIAIMDFTGQDVAFGDAKKISELIRTEMINTGQYVVIERNEMGKILQEQGLAMTGCTFSCAVQAGKLLSARKMLVGTIMKLDESFIINGRIIDVEKGTAEFAQKEMAQTRKDLVKTVDAFVNKITLRIAPKGYAKQYEDYEKKLDPRKQPKDSDKYAWIGFSFILAGVAGTGTYIYYGQLRSKVKSDTNAYDNYTRIRMYTAIGTALIGGTGIVMGIVWLVKMNEEKSMGVNGAIPINNTYSLLLPPQYYNECLNFSKKNQYGLGLGCAMRF